MNETDVSDLLDRGTHEEVRGRKGWVDVNSVTQNQWTINTEGNNWSSRYFCLRNGTSTNSRVMDCFMNRVSTVGYLYTTYLLVVSLRQVHVLFPGLKTNVFVRSFSVLFVNSLWMICISKCY